MRLVYVRVSGCVAYTLLHILFKRPLHVCVLLWICFLKNKRDPVVVGLSLLRARGAARPHHHSLRFEQLGWQKGAHEQQLFCTEVFMGASWAQVQQMHWCRHIFLLILSLPGLSISLSPYRLVVGRYPVGGPIYGEPTHQGQSWGWTGEDDWQRRVTWFGVFWAGSLGSK